MAPPLTKRTKDGTIYTRPPAVDAQIEEVGQFSLAELNARLDLVGPERQGYLRSETLVHLLRRAIGAGSMATFNAVLPILLKRCEKTLEGKIFNSLPGADQLREEILGQFSELLASDGHGDIPNELDFYECRFNSAFRTFWIDHVTREVRHSGRFTGVETEAELDEAAGDDEPLRVLSDSLHHDSPESRLRLQQLIDAIEALPAKERDAVVLVHIMGFKEESNDPHEETAATRCSCTGRTIRNRLASAVAKLARFQENK